MKTYVLTVEIDEGNDEFWEEIALLKAREARKEVRAEVERCLEDHGFFKPESRVRAVLTRRAR